MNFVLGNSNTKMYQVFCYYFFEKRDLIIYLYYPIKIIDLDFENKMYLGKSYS